MKPLQAGIKLLHIKHYDMEITIPSYCIIWERVEVYNSGLGHIGTSASIASQYDNLGYSICLWSWI